MNRAELLAVTAAIDALIVRVEALRERVDLLTDALEAAAGPSVEPPAKSKKAAAA